MEERVLLICYFYLIPERKSINFKKRTLFTSINSLLNILDVVDLIEILTTFFSLCPC